MRATCVLAVRPPHPNTNTHIGMRVQSMLKEGWCVWSQSIVSSGVLQIQEYSIYRVHRHIQIQMQIAEVTQRSDRMGRDPIANRLREYDEVASECSHIL